MIVHKRNNKRKVGKPILLVPWASNRLRAGGFLTFVGMRSLALRKQNGAA